MWLMTDFQISVFRMLKNQTLRGARDHSYLGRHKSHKNTVTPQRTVDANNAGDLMSES